MKLLHYLQIKGYASSNKNAKKLIRHKRVIVNGSNASSCSMAIHGNFDDQVVVLTGSNLNNDVILIQNNKSSMEKIVDTKPFCIVYNKPCGMICTTAKDCTDVNGEIDTLANADIPNGFHPIGRLDRHSHGLLLFSSDGRLTSALLSPRTCVQRVYEIIVRGDVGSKGEDRYVDIMQRVENGVETDYGFFQGEVLDMIRDVGKYGYVHENCKCDSGAKRNDKYGMTPEQYEKSKVIEQCTHGNIMDSATPKHYDTDILSWIKVSVKEGKKRMVRRLFAALDLFVLGESDSCG